MKKQIELTHFSLKWSRFLFVYPVLMTIWPGAIRVLKSLFESDWNAWTYLIIFAVSGAAFLGFCVSGFILVGRLIRGLRRHRSWAWPISFLILLWQTLSCFFCVWDELGKWVSEQASLLTYLNFLASMTFMVVSVAGLAGLCTRETIRKFFARSSHKKRRRVRFSSQANRHLHIAEGAGRVVGS